MESKFDPKIFNKENIRKASYSGFYSVLDSLLEVKTAKELSDSLRQISDKEEVEGLFMKLFDYIIVDKTTAKENLEFIIDIFSNAGKDVEFMTRPNFARKLLEPNLYLTHGPLTKEQENTARELQKYVSTYTSRYADVYRIPNLPLDIKKKIQGYTTNFDPVTARENRKLFLIDKLKGKYNGLENLSLRELENLNKN